MEFMFIHRVISLENIGVYHLIANFKNDGVEHMCFISYINPQSKCTRNQGWAHSLATIVQRKKKTQELQNHQKWNELKAGRDRYKPCYLGVFLPPSHAYSLPSVVYEEREYLSPHTSRCCWLVAFLPLCCNRWYFCIRLHPVDFHVKYAPTCAATLVIHTTYKFVIFKMLF